MKTTYYKVTHNNNNYMYNTQDAKIDEINQRIYATLLDSNNDVAGMVVADYDNGEISNQIIYIARDYVPRKINK